MADNQIDSSSGAQGNQVRAPVAQYSEQLLDEDGNAAEEQHGVSDQLRRLAIEREERKAGGGAGPSGNDVIAPKLDNRTANVYDAQEIEALKAKYPDGLGYQLEPYVELEGDENRLDLANLEAADKEAKEKANFFACAICTMVVYEPTECKSCNSLFCKECLAPWTASNEHCPKKCKGNEAVEFGAIHRFAKQELESMKFRCQNPKCDSVNKYADALAHIRTCDLQLQACPQGCGLGIMGQDREYHFKLQCVNTKYICPVCEEEVFPNKPGQEAHDCIKTLKRLLAEQRAENSALRIQIAEGASHPQVAAGGNQVGQVAGGGGQAGAGEQISMSCPAGHPLRAQYGRISDYQNVFCDICQATNLNDHPKFYRCAACKYDVCASCAEA